MKTSLSVLILSLVSGFGATVPDQTFRNVDITGALSSAADLFQSSDTLTNLTIPFDGTHYKRLHIGTNVTVTLLTSGTIPVSPMDARTIVVFCVNTNTNTVTWAAESGTIFWGAIPVDQGKSVTQFTYTDGMIFAQPLSGGSYNPTIGRLPYKSGAAEWGDSALSMDGTNVTANGTEIIGWKALQAESVGGAATRLHQQGSSLVVSNTLNNPVLLIASSTYPTERLQFYPRLATNVPPFIGTAACGETELIIGLDGVGRNIQFGPLGIQYPNQATAFQPFTNVILAANPTPGVGIGLTYQRIAGTNGAPQTVTTTPSFATNTGIIDGSWIILEGSSDTATVTFQDESALPGSRLWLGEASVTFSNHTAISFIYNRVDNLWVRIR